MNENILNSLAAKDFGMLYNTPFISWFSETFRILFLLVLIVAAFISLVSIVLDLYYKKPIKSLVFLVLLASVSHLLIYARFFDVAENFAKTAMNREGVTSYLALSGKFRPEVVDIIQDIGFSDHATRDLAVYTLLSHYSCFSAESLLTKACHPDKVNQASELVLSEYNSLKPSSDDSFNLAALYKENIASSFKSLAESEAKLVAAGKLPLNKVLSLSKAYKGGNAAYFEEKLLGEWALAFLAQDSVRMPKNKEKIIKELSSELVKDCSGLSGITCRAIKQSILILSDGSVFDKQVKQSELAGTFADKLKKSEKLFSENN